jgi:L-seryl-tRNA(Ser) seleniumtransferase
MRKAAAVTPGTAAASLRSIPSVERILSSPSFVRLASEFGREGVKHALASYLDEVRRAAGRWDDEGAAGEVRSRLQIVSSHGLRHVINGTGVIIHTNLGRAPIGEGMWDASAETVTAYSNLEFDLSRGERGKRDDLLSSLCRSLFGCEAAVLTNNNAAAVLLLLSAVAAKKEVIVSRGELVEIGGGFRVPEVIEQGGAKLREVGTTNRTRPDDYESAISRKSAAILRVHRSNFDIVGFTKTPSIEDLVDVARSRKVPFLFDEGSGRVVDLQKYGFSSEPAIRELIAAGVDAVTCSTDKLIGATQGGLILGRADIIERCRRHPLMRALRAGKESYALIGATLRAFATGKHEDVVPIYRMLSAPIEDLRARARNLGGHVVESRAVLGGGTTPSESMPSVAVALPGNAASLYERFLAFDPPIVGRVSDDRFMIDVRTVLPLEYPVVSQAIATIR